MNRILLIFLISFSFLCGYAITDTIYVSDKNSSYIEFSGALSYCDLGVYAGEDKKVSKNEQNAAISIKSSNYLVKVSNGIATVIAEKPNARKSKLLIRTSEHFYELTLLYADIQGDIHYYNLNERQEQQKASSHSSGSYSSSGSEYAELNDLPENIDINQKRELLKYDPSTVRSRLRFVLENFNDYKEIGDMGNDVSVIVTALANDATHFYVKVKFTNKSHVDFRIENTSFQYVQVSKDRLLSKKSRNTTDLNNVLKLEDQIVNGNAVKEFGYALPIFAVDDRSYIQITFYEFQGDRDLTLKIYSKHLNVSDKI